MYKYCVCCQNWFTFYLHAYIPLLQMVEAFIHIIIHNITLEIMAASSQCPIHCIKKGSVECRESTCESYVTVTTCYKFSNLYYVGTTTCLKLRTILCKAVTSRVLNLCGPYCWSHHRLLCKVAGSASDFAISVCCELRSMHFISVC